ncbi:hypothetical protein QTP88_001532 [Uroleucon formosanum]
MLCTFLQCGTFEILTSSGADNTSKPNPSKIRRETPPKWKSKMHPNYNDVPINEEQKCVAQLVENYGKSDLLKFIGIMILTGYHSLPKIENYWSKDEE